MWNKYDNFRRVRTLEGVVQLRLKVRRCATPECERFCQAYRPEAEGKWTLPQHEFGLDVMALVGGLRYLEHRSVAQIHQVLHTRGVSVGERSVSNLLARYDELVSLEMGNIERIGKIVAQQSQVILAIDGLQPQVGHEVLWVIREVISGEILLARPLLSSSSEDLIPMLVQVKQGLSVPIVGVVSDGQTSIRKAVSTALPEVAHGLCHFPEGVTTYGRSEAGQEIEEDVIKKDRSSFVNKTYLNENDAFILPRTSTIATESLPISAVELSDSSTTNP
jgi:hypothetical protein